MMNFLADIEKLARSIQVPTTDTTKNDNKRKADEMTGSSYEDSNKELRELYLARQKTRQNNLPPENDPNNPVEKVHVDLSSTRKTPGPVQGNSFLLTVIY